MTNRLPPFGREVSRVLQCPQELKRYSGCTPHRATIWVATGSGAWDWRYRHPKHLTVIMPFGSDPWSYFWGFIRGHEPPLILPPVSEDDTACQELAAAMLKDGVLALLALRDSRCRRYVREAA